MHKFDNLFHEKCFGPLLDFFMKNQTSLRLQIWWAARYTFRDVVKISRKYLIEITTGPRQKMLIMSLPTTK